VEKPTFIVIEYKLKERRTYAMEEINMGNDIVISTGNTTKAIVAEGINPARFTKKEKQILKLTERAWNLFLEISEQYVGERKDMEGKIHEVQRMIISRPGFRINREMLNHEK
jgi:hypothetical protein